MALGDALSLEALSEQENEDDEDEDEDEDEDGAVAQAGGRGWMGIAAMVARNKSRLHEVWRWMSVVSSPAFFSWALMRSRPARAERSFASRSARRTTSAW
mgnify:CR=1 FL=1